MGQDKPQRARRGADGKPSLEPNPPDPELQRALGLDGLDGLDQLLTGQAAGDSITADRVGALVRLIAQALRADRDRKP